MLADLIEPLGIATYAMLVITVFLGVARWKLHWRRPKPIWHYAAGIATLLLGTAHAVIIMMLE
jgi:hypothetical protein